MSRALIPRYPTGLSDHEAALRRRRDGYNE
jgi:hypothetical protein